MENKLFEAIREQLNSQSPEAIYVQRAPEDGDTSVMGNVIPVDVAELDIIGYEPIWEQMGVEVYRGVQGTYTLPFEDPIIGAKLAELAPVTGDTITPSGNLISPKRFSVQKTFTLETLNSATDSFLSKVMQDMVRGCDRAITQDVYGKIIAGASEVAGADITKDGFDALMAAAEVELDGSFFSARATFFEAKSVAIDAGSGRFLVETIGTATIGQGRTYDGVPYWYSNLFNDGVDTQYVCYGDASRIHVADYEALEVIVDKFTAAAEGKVIFTVNKIADVALKNPNAFSRTPDLNPA